MDTQDELSRYTADYYRRPIMEYWYAQVGLLRPDQYAAVCYAFGVPFYGDEPYFANPGPRPTRTPARVMSVGCGEGVLEAELERLGCEVTGVDPSPGAVELYRGKTRQDGIDGIEGYDTVILCESLEHLPRELTNEIRTRLAPGARMIVTNWLSLHPIPNNSSWDHITTVDDAMFEWLSMDRTVVVRRGAHLVVDRP